MNPWGLYEQKPQLLQATAVAIAVWLVRRSIPRGAAAIATLCAAAWALIGIAQWVVYAFGYQMAGWTARDIDTVSSILEWPRLVVVCIGAVAVVQHRRA